MQTQWRKKINSSKFINTSPPTEDPSKSTRTATIENKQLESG